MSKKILVIESDTTFAEGLAAALSARGLEPLLCADGKEGLELARADRPDAIVLCVELPKLSGYAVCNKLKKDDALKSIPLLLTSAEANEETFEAHRKLKARADDYLMKPFGEAVLLERLGRLLNLTGEGERSSAADLGSADTGGMASAAPGGELEDLTFVPEEELVLDDAAPSFALPVESARDEEDLALDLLEELPGSGMDGALSSAPLDESAADEAAAEIASLREALGDRERALTAADARLRQAEERASAAEQRANLASAAVAALQSRLQELEGSGAGADGPPPGDAHATGSRSSGSAGLDGPAREQVRQALLAALALLGDRPSGAEPRPEEG